MVISSGCFKFRVGSKIFKALLKQLVDCLKKFQVILKIWVRFGSGFVFRCLFKVGSSFGCSITGGS
jgi:hypothetical protein